MNDGSSKIEVWVALGKEDLLFADSEGDLNRCNFRVGPSFSGRCQKPTMVEEVILPKFDRLVLWAVKLLSNALN